MNTKTQRRKNWLQMISLWWLSAIMCVWMGAVSSSQAAVTLTPVLDSEVPMPGADTNFKAFDAPGLDAGGYVSFGANGNRSDGSIFRGIYTLNGATLTTVANYDTEIPDASGTGAGLGNFVAVGEWVPSNGGAVAFKGYDSSFGVGRLYSNYGGTLRLIMGENTPVPDRTGTSTLSNFTGANVVGMSTGGVVFRGFGSGGERGFYEWSPGGHRLMIDKDDEFPGVGNFDGFNIGAVDGDDLVIQGLANGVVGVLHVDAAGNLRTVADTLSPIPNGTGNFTNMWYPDIHNGEAAFRGQGSSGQLGVYAEHEGSLLRVADLSTPEPAGTGGFTSFFDIVLLEGRVVFLATRADGATGLYAFDKVTGGLEAVLATGQSLDGHTVSSIYMLPVGGAEDTLAVSLHFSGGFRALYVVGFPPSNEAPVADAGNDQGAAVGAVVNLTGLASSDDLTPTGLLNFQWSLVSSPSGSEAALVGDDSATPSVVPDMPGTYEISLIVTDEHGLPSVANSMFVEAELSPAFVFERIHSGGGSYYSLYDEDDGYWSSMSESEYWRPAVLRHGEILGQKYFSEYFRDSLTGTYSNDSSYHIGKLSHSGEEIFVSTGDDLPGSNGDTFRYLWLEGNDDDHLYFRGYGSNYDYVNSFFKFDVTAEVVTTDAAVTPPVPVAGDADELTSLWRDYDSALSGPRFYRGSNGSCPRYRAYTNYYGDTYSYCIRHYGLYLIDAGVATRIVDNTVTVPGEGPDDYFYSFFSPRHHQQTGDVYFVGYWLDDAESKYRQGIFRGNTSGVLEKLLDDQDLDWDRGWFDSLRIEEGNLYAGGSRYQSGYDSGSWWSSSQQGIFRVSNTEVEGLVTGGDSYWYHNNWYDNFEYSYLATRVNTWDFQVQSGALAYSRYLYSYRYDDTSYERQYDQGLFWMEEGLERRIAGSSDEILGLTYDGVSSVGRGDWMEGRSVVMLGSANSYTSEYDAAESQYTYSSNYIVDVLVARFDTDRDGIGDDLDNCPERPNADQNDSDLNGIGDVCEDSDADTVVDHLDNCPLIANVDQSNNDSDDFGNACDVCPDVADNQRDVDNDGLGDACDDNSDSDSLVDSLDNCPFIANEDQSNLDNDVLGDVCDPDIDGDGIDNEVDGEWDGIAFNDESLIASDNFSDHAMGGMTFGRIQSRGQLVVLISDAPDGDRGILVNAVNGTGSGLIKQCDYRGQDAKVDLQQGTIAIIDCGSIAVETVANFTQIILDSELVISVPAQVAARVIDVSESGFVVANESEAPFPIDMNLGNELSVTLPEGTIGGFEETAPGQFQIQNRPESVQPIVAVANGRTLLFEPGDIGVPVQIDIKPGSENNAIHLGSNGVIPVAILSEGDFDATSVDPLTVRLASSEVRLKGKGTPASQVSDVNGDGLDDLVVQVETENLVLAPTDSTAKLTGSTFAGIEFIGEDAVTIVPPE